MTGKILWWNCHDFQEITESFTFLCGPVHPSVGDLLINLEAIFIIRIT